MLVKEAMTGNAEYIHSGTLLVDAAKKMADLDCGFLPIGDSEQDKLQGVITDRDIAIRGVAGGLDPKQASVGEIKTDKVLYCFEDDDVKDAAENMRDQQVYRLIVLNNKDEKKLCGVISLGDIVRQGQDEVASNAAKGITSKAA
ncbi:MAG: CBS domain-containing protein [Gammaproteobacteria bacterium]